MATLNLLCVGGPKHGEFQAAEKDTFYVVISSPGFYGWDRERYCVHEGHVTSNTDGQRHFISSGRVAELYRLNPREWRIAPQFGHPYGNYYCVYPDQSGRYDRASLRDLGPSSYTSMTIRRGVYQTRTVSDRAVFLYVGEE